MNKLWYDLETSGLSPATDRIISCVFIDDEGTKKEFLLEELNDKSERKMLREMLNYIKKYKVLIGWNSESFDHPFFFKRLMKLDFNLYDELNPFMYKKRTIFGDLEDRITIKQFELLDLMVAYKKYSFTNPPSYKLDDVCRYHLDIGKIDLQSELPITIYNAGRFDELMDYNRVDVELMIKLENELGLIDLMKEINELSGCRLQKCTAVGHIANAFFEKLGIAEDVPPNGHYLPEDIKSNEGGLNMEADAGVYSNVLCADFSSQYPAIILDFNIVPELREPILDLMKLKNNSKGKKRDAVKSVLNGISYGALSYKYSSLYRPKEAAEITEKGRMLIQTSWDLAESLGYKPIMTSTDSIYIENGDIEFIETANNKFKKMINKDEVFTNLELEAVYDKMMLTGKIKNNARLKGDDIMFTGTPIKRRTTLPNIIPVLYEEIVREILNGTRNFKDFEKMIREKIKNASLIDIAIPYSLKKDFKKGVSYKAKAVQWTIDNYNKTYDMGERVYIVEVKHSKVNKAMPDFIGLSYYELTDNEDYWLSQFVPSRNKVHDICVKTFKELFDALNIGTGKDVQISLFDMK